MRVRHYVLIGLAVAVTGTALAEESVRSLQRQDGRSGTDISPDYQKTTPEIKGIGDPAMAREIPGSAAPGSVEGRRAGPGRPDVDDAPAETAPRGVNSPDDPARPATTTGPGEAGTAIDRKAEDRPGYAPSGNSRQGAGQPRKGDKAGAAGGNGTNKGNVGE